MAFNLAEAAGFGKLVSNLDNMEIRQLPISLLAENEENYFRVEDVQDLKDSMALRGILQPLLVVTAGDRYRVIAGHRRKKAAAELLAEGNRNFDHVPCIVLPEMSDAMEQLLLIQTNTTARELSYTEKMESVRRLKATLMTLREEGVQIPGKLRDIVAEQLEISRTEQARMQVIDKRLSDEWKTQLNAGEINAFCAYELARIPAEDQAELRRQQLAGDHSVMTQNVVERYMIRKRSADWVVSDCPLSKDGYYNAERRKKGLPVPCPDSAVSSILKRKDKGHPEKCPGCCYNCLASKDCKQCCSEVSLAHARESDRSRRDAELKAKQHAFSQSRLSGIPDRIAELADEFGYDSTDFKTLFAAAYQKLVAQPEMPPYYDYDAMCAADTASALPMFMVSTVAFCEALEITPDWLLGFAAPASAGWIRFDAEKPPEGARVVVRRVSAGLDLVGEYLYRGGKWYSAALDDFEMNVTNVTHWILSPEV